MAGEPEIFGAWLLGAELPLTVMVNGVSDAVVLPSLTLMMMLENVPAAVGVPLNVPVLVAKEAHSGRFWML